MTRFASLSLVALATPALADMTAIYRVSGSTKASENVLMKLETAANGDIHGDMLIGADGTTFVMRAGETYLIQPGRKGAVVRVDDLTKVVAEHAEWIDPLVRATAEKLKSGKLVERGIVKVNGRTGTAYFWQYGDGQFSADPRLVISDDPALAPLTRAVSIQFGIETLMMGEMKESGAFKSMADLLNRGAPLKYGPAELQSVSNDPIPPERFGLPSQPISIDKLRKEINAVIESSKEARGE